METNHKNNSLQRQKLVSRYIYRKDGYVYVAVVYHNKNKATIGNPFVIDKLKEKYFDGSITAIKTLLSVAHNLRSTLHVKYFDLSEIYEDRSSVTFSDIVKFLK